MTAIDVRNLVKRFGDKTVVEPLDQVADVDGRHGSAVTSTICPGCSRELGSSGRASIR